MRLRAVLCLAIPLALSAAPLRATETVAPDDILRVVLPTVSIEGAPRSLVTLVIAVPVELQQTLRIRYRVEPSGAIEVLGRLNGEISGGVNARSRTVLLTLRVPSDALVGDLAAADVVFTDDDAREFVVPIILRVPAVLAIRLSGDREFVNLSAGDRLELAYRVQNLGNAPEVLDVEVQAPIAWQVQDHSRRSVTVPPHGVADVAVGLRVPAFAPGGDAGVTVSLRRRDAADTTVAASARTVLRVRDAAPRPLGLILEPYVALTQTSTGSGLGSGARLSGPLIGDVRVRAQFSPLRATRGQEMALAAAGAYQMPFVASVYTPDWNVDVGMTQLALGDLTGLFVAGQGVSARATTGTRELIGIVARPTFNGSRSGQVIGGGAWWQTEIGRVGGSFSMLEEAGSGSRSGRQLKAIGGDWTSHPLGDLVLSAGTAVREYGEGATLGYRMQALHERERDRVRVRFAHAPGGSRAFASVTDEMQLEGRRQLTERLSLTVDASSSRDAGGVFESISSNSMSIGPRYQFSALTILGARLTRSSNDAKSSIVGLGGFGTTALGGSANLSTGFGEWRLSTDAQVNSVNRRATLLSGAIDERVALQSYVNTIVSRSLATLGQVAAGVSMSAAGAGSGLPTTAFSTFARWSGLPLVIAGQVIRAESEGRVFTSDLDGTRTAFRAGLATSFRGGFEIAASASRSPFVRDAQGNDSWVMALRISTSAEVLSNNRLSTPGTVFLDTDGDGRHDPEERGVPGVVLRYASLRITTGRNGEYRLPSDMRGRLRVDPSSLPLGLVAHPRLALDSVERRDIPLVATGTRAVQLRIEADADGRAPSVDLDLVDIWLRDRDGFEWVGHSLGGGRFLFEQVPVGDYSLRLNSERLAEPVRTDETTLRVRAGTTEDLVVPVRGRAVRFITPPRGGGRGGSAATPGGR